MANIIVPNGNAVRQKHRVYFVMRLVQITAPGVRELINLKQLNSAITYFLNSPVFKKMPTN